MVKLTFTISGTKFPSTFTVASAKLRDDTIDPGLTCIEMSNGEIFYTRDEAVVIQRVADVIAVKHEREMAAAS